MSSPLGLPPVDRPAFFYGQRLTADDLSTTQDAHRHLRWLHNRTLHTWGIALGMSVSGERGARDVRVEAGYAVDCQGRELLLPEAQRIPVPPSAGEGSDAVSFYLTAAYPDDAVITQTRAGVCDTSGAVRLSNRAILRWQRTDDEIGELFETWRGKEVILATVQVRDCKLAARVSLADRREAKPSDQPYLTAGSTESGSTTWQWWPEGGQVSEAQGVMTTVDTSLAAFQGVPRYFAHVIGTREIAEKKWVLEGFVRVHKATSTGFQLVMLLPRGLPSVFGWAFNPAVAFNNATLDSMSGTWGWHVVWMGVEP
jgi:hypothetical protein